MSPYVKCLEQCLAQNKRYDICTQVTHYRQKKKHVESPCSPFDIRRRLLPPRKPSLTWSEGAGTCHHRQTPRPQVGKIPAVTKGRSSFVGCGVCVLEGGV